MVLCLGPHRSGTSTVTAALAALGADIGFSDIYANDENQKGFFEHPDLILLNERILDLIGGAWDAPAFHGAAAIARAGSLLDPLRQEAAAFLQSHFPTATLAALKDPRMCVLLGFWLPVLRQAGFGRIDCVHVLRDPADAAVSQRARVQSRPGYYEIGRHLGEGAALWLSYSAQMWDDFDQSGHIILPYDGLIDQPDASLNRLAAFLGVEAKAEGMARFKERFLDANLRHNSQNAAARAQIDDEIPQARVLFDGMAALAGKDSLTAADLGFAQQAHRDAQPMMVTLQSAAAARLSNKKRADSAEILRLNDVLAEAEKAKATLRDMAAASADDFRADIAKREAGFQSERMSRDAFWESFADDLVQTHGPSRFEADKAQGAAKKIRAVMAALGAQSQHDRLTFERDLERVRKSEAETLARLVALHASRSWKVTAPLRAAGQFLRLASDKARGLWVQFNRIARQVYRGLDKRSPRLAEALRRVVIPFFRFGNRAILRSDFGPAAASHARQSRGQGDSQLAYQRLQARPEAHPLVTVLVPNYNHAPYLRQRLDSIFAQSWQNFEVILMDDCSTDDSRSILQEYADRYPDRARVMFNDTNSGGAFYQWEKGLRAAKGDLIWVAESDDWCSPNFLETLVPFFANEAVQLAYVPTHFMNKDGTEQVWSMAEYLADLGPERWAHPFVMTAPQIVREAFAEKNIIPNVSSALFRRLDRLEVLENDVWRGMKTCGDWVFYLNQIRGGLIAYSPQAQNFYRLHPTNTSVGSFSKDSYYIEHETVAKTVQRHYGVDAKVFERQLQNLILHWTRNRPSFVRAEFDACYSLDRITAEAAKRKPRLLMAGYAFCSGGGETFPITLANVMKTAGYDITYLNFAQEPDIPGIRQQLARDIPVVSNFEDLNGILRDFDIEVIHSHHAWADNTILDILPENSPVKTVITLHGMYETLSDEQLKRTLPRLVKRTGAMVYIAEKNISALVTRGLARAQDLPRIDNALAIGPVTPVDRASLGIAPDAFVLTVVSRAIAPKGWQEAIEAVTLAREQSGKDIHLILVGDGPEYDRLLGQVPAFVHLEGFRSNTRDYFAAADVGLLASRFKGESFPLVLIDCLHAGRPVISSDLGEIPYMLTTPDGVAGALFALEDWQVPIDRLAALIGDLACHPDHLAAMAAQVPEAAKRFDPVLMRDRYDLVYQGVIQPNANPQTAEFLAPPLIPAQENRG